MKAEARERIARDSEEIAMGTPGRSRRVLAAALWIGQILLALIFGMSGLMKATMPIPELSKSAAWVTAVPPPLVRFIGVAELLGAAGVLLPAMTRILPKLTPLAALGLATIMELAVFFHLSRGEMSAAAITFGFALLAAFVAWGRLRGVPVSPRASPPG
jgi:uncharacterized membrane protein YphA (DoxX/SURF4 family)